MTRCCIIEGCNSKSGNPQHRGVTFHSFPFDSKTRELWLVNCCISAEKNITKRVLVCSRHFRRADFQPMKGNKFLLKAGAVPTIFPWGKLPEHNAGPSELMTCVTEVISGQAPIQLAENSADLLSSAVLEPKQVKRHVEEESDEASPNKIVKLEPDDQQTLQEIQQPIIDIPPASTSSDMKYANLPVSRKAEPPTFTPGNKLEAQDFDGLWHNARVVEVDSEEKEVLIRFEKTGKIKGSTGGVEEWIPMNSSRLRQKVVQTSSKSHTVYQVGDKCLARWSGSRRFPATVNKVLGNDTYEVLFDDGYIKVVKGAHMSKMKTAEKMVTGGNKNKVVGPSTSVSTNSSKKDWPLISINSLNLSELNLPLIPKDGEWCCHWVNDQPIGKEGFLTVGDHRKPTVIVEDWRLPPNWTKHMYQRSNVLGKWDVILINPLGKRFRSKADLKQYVEELGQPYNPDVYDFSIHRRRAKDIGAYVHTKDYKAPKPNVPESTKAAASSASPAASVNNILPQTNSPIVSQVVIENIQPTSASASIAEEESFSLEDGYVYVGSLKVQIIDNLFRCPHESCNKNFRKENHLQIHIKHYHEDIAKLLGVCPNMQELACKRTIGQPTEEPLPKNHLPNAQFFAKLHQQDLQSKTHRKSLSTHIGGTPGTSQLLHSLGLPTNSPTSSIEVADIKVETENLEVPPTTILSETTVDVYNNTVIKTESEAFQHSTGDVSDREEQQPPVVIPQKQKKSTGHIRKGGRQRVSKKYVATQVQQTPPPPVQTPAAPVVQTPPAAQPHAASTTTVFEGNLSINDFEETRHSFNGTPENKILKKEKIIQSSAFVGAASNIDGNSHTTGSFPELSQSPKYISENGEIIKIVRMRQEEIINCLCSYGEEDGLMIQCELCLCWQHGICNGIEKESQVPEKYICYICRNPQRGRASLKYIHDQDWLYEGKLPVADYHAQNPGVEERFEILKKTHILTGNLLELRKFMHSLKVKINIADKKDHPKMYLWSKKWEMSPPKDLKSEADNSKHSHSVVSNNDGISFKMDPSPKKDIQQNYDSEKENTEENNKLSNDIAGSSSTTNLKENIADITGQDAIENQSSGEVSVNEKTLIQPPTIPQPEAPIDPAECQHRLLEHIQKQQQSVMNRLEVIESEIIEIESLHHSKVQEEVDCPKTKRTLATLIKDLETMRNVAKINTLKPTYADY